MKIFDCLIIGLGKVGLTYDLNKKSFLTHVKSVEFHQNFRLKGVIDSDVKKRKLFKNYYDYPTYCSIEEASINKYSLVIVAVPTDSHLKVITKVLKNIKPKVILCEKPLSYNSSDAKAIVNLCKKYNVELFVNYIRRSDPSVKKIKMHLDTLKKSTVKGVCWYNKGLLHSCTHFLDLCDYWLGSLKKIKLISKKKKLGKNDFCLDFSAEFKNGEVTFFSSDKYFSHYSIELFSNLGRIRYDYEGNLVYLNKKKEFFEDIQEIEKKKIIIKNEMKVSQLNVLNEIYNFLEKRSYFLCSGKDSLKNNLKIFKFLEII